MNAIFFLAMLQVVAVARDPFVLKQKHSNEVAHISMQGIAVSGQRRVALLSYHGEFRTVGIGDYVGEYCITKIHEQCIELVSSEKVVQLSVA